MAANVPRGVAVVDIGATNSKVALFDSALEEIDRRKTETVHHEGPPYRHVDAQRIVEFAVGAIGELDRVLPIDVIVVSAFGSTLGCVDETGALATPVMDYLAEPPEAIAAGYAKIAPPFSETFCNTWPSALSLGRQLYWLETAFPETFARVRTIMTWSQYLAFRLGGRMTSEITALGAFSQLLDVLNGRLSSVVRQRGWAERFAPLTRAWDDIGELKREFRPADFRGRGRILCGVHDSDANYLRYLAARLQRARAAFDRNLHHRLRKSGGHPAPRSRSRDVLLHQRVRAPDRLLRFLRRRRIRQAACRRFAVGRLGGRNRGDRRALRVRPAVVQRHRRSGRRKRQSRTDRRSLLRRCRERASLATLYTALMTAEALDALESRSPIVIDGPFARNDLYCSLLAALRPGQKVSSSLLQEGTSVGAALLALMNPAGDLPKRQVELKPHAPAEFAGLRAYQSMWQAKARAAAR